MVCAHAHAGPPAPPLPPLSARRGCPCPCDTPPAALPPAPPPERREMLGIMDQLRYNGVDYSPATQTRRSFCMRVKLQLVICSDEGHEETVTEVMTLNKNSQRIEHLGLTLAVTC